MRVLQINSVCGAGSTGRIVTDIHKILREQGHESYIAYGRGTAHNCDTSIKIGTKFDNYMHVAKTRLLDKHGLSSKRATKEFITKVEKLNPDIIHLHNIHGYYLHIELLFDFLKSAGKPVVWTLHDCWPFTGHCAYFDYVQCDRWRTGCYSCPQKKNYPASMLLDSSSDNYETKKKIFSGVENLLIVTPSKWLASLVKQSFLNQYPVKVINNGIDLSIFKPTDSDFRKRYNLNEKFVILGVASIWEPRKGFKYFLELSNYLTSNEMIVLVGVTEKQKRIFPNNIIGITKTNNIKELAAIYSAADVFFNPTLEDNFPTTNLEALACGTPVITFNTGGSVEAIDESSGFVIEQGNLSKTLETIEIVKHQEFHQNCILRALKLFDKNRSFSQYIDLYISLAKNLEDEKVFR